MLLNIKNIIKTHKSYIFYYFIFVLILLLPKAITMPSLSFKSSICTAIGLDTVDNKIEVSVLTLADVSKNDTSEKTKILSSVGDNVVTAVNEIEFNIDRKIRMGHAGYIVVSQNLATNFDVAKLLQNLVVATNLPKTVSLVMTNTNSKDVLALANKLEHTSSYKLREIIQNEYNENYTKDSNIDLFLKGYYSHIKTSTMSYITLTKDINKGLNTNEQEEPKKQKSCKMQNDIIDYKREHAAFVNGKFKYILNKQEMRGINFLAENNLQQIVTIQNVDYKSLKDASISFNAKTKSIKTNVVYRNNRPIVTFNLMLSLKPLEINSNAKTELLANDINLTKEIKYKVEQSVKKDILFTINKLREEKTDLVNIYETIFSGNSKKCEMFFKSLQKKDDFLSHIVVKVNVFCKIMIN